MKAALGLCVLIFFVGLQGVATDGGLYHDMPVDAWAYQGITLVGALGILWHLYAMWHEKKHPKPKVPLDEQCAQAKADLDRMYLREHGTMPEWPEREEANKEKKENV